MKANNRILSLLLVLVMAFSVLTGCGAPANDKVDPPVTQAPEVTTTEGTTEPEVTTTEETTTEAVTTTEETTTEVTTTTEATTTTEETTTEVTTTTEATTTEAAKATIEVEDISGEVYKYATSSVNVRDLPDANGERIGHLDAGEKVRVTGIAANGWYRIEFKNGEYFVSGKYLSDTYTAPEKEEDKPTGGSHKPSQNKTHKVSLTSDNWASDAFLDESFVKYNSDGSVYIETGTIVGWAIPEVKMGETVKVNVKGSSVGEFRMWLLAPGQATASNIMPAIELGNVGGDFDFTFELTAEDHDERNISAATSFCFKAPTWNSSLNKLTIKSIEITYLGNTNPEKVDDSVNKPKSPSPDTIWLASWGSAQLQAGDDHLPKTVALKNNTVRMQIRPSVGGNKLRLEFSNECGKTSLVINKATLAKLIDPKKSDIDTSSLTSITFGGKSGITISAGKTVVSDEIDFSFASLDDLAVTLYLGDVPHSVTSHTASRCSTWVSKGDGTKSKSLSGDVTTSWYFLSRLEVLADKNAKAIVCMGDSLTDGASITTNGFARWTDELARQLNKNGYSDYSVINMGIGATSLMGWGTAGEARFKRDVLDIEGVDSLIIFYGVNDIGYASSDVSQKIINTYKSMIKQCHDNGIKVYGMTITPFKGSGYYSELHEKIRVKVNEFILSPDSGFDGYIDAASAVADPDDSEKMRKSYVSVWNDNLHFNDTGYKFVGKTVFEKLEQYLK